MALLFLILFNQFLLISHIGIEGFGLINNKMNNGVFIQSDDLKFNATNAYDHIIKQLNFGFRVPGYSAHNECANWIRAELQENVDEITTHIFIIHKPTQPAYACQNILGVLNPNKTEIVIFGAHWDSRAVAEKDSVNRYSPIPGANDGASGVAVLLELARVLNQIKISINAQIWFLFLDAEDQGRSAGIYGIQGWSWCEGSMAFNHQLDEFYNSENESIECFILLDMVGGTNLQFIDESQSTDRLLNALFSEGQNLGYLSQFPLNPKVNTITDDHVYFLQNGIPSADLIIDFINGDWSYHHTHSDNLANIDPNSLNVTGRTLESFIKTYYIGSENPYWGPVNYIGTLEILLIVSILCIGIVSTIMLWDWYRERKRNR